MRNLCFFFILLSIGSSLSSCAGCSESGIRNSEKNKKYATNSNIESGDSRIKNRKENFKNESYIIKMQKIDGVYQIPVKINGVEMYFIFDSGASLISISAKKAGLLYKQGKLNDNDFVGTANFKNANGDISEGSIIIIQEVTIGNITLSNIEASVVDNINAPLLFGQSALEKFAKYSVDYEKNEILLEY